MSTGYQFFNPLAPSIYAALKEDIAAHGVLVPVVLDEKGRTLDGHHRRQICAELHIECPSIVMEGLDEEAKEAVVLVLNTHRRQLSGKEKTDSIIRLRGLGWSTRKIASLVGVHHSTVARAGVANATPASAPTSPVPHGTPEPDAPEGSAAPVEPPEGETGGADLPAAPPAPPPVKGADGKTYRKPPTRKPKPEQSSDEAYKATVWREMTKTFDGLLALDPVRAVEVTPPAEHGSLIALAERLERWSMEVHTAASTRPNLKAVSDAS